MINPNIKKSFELQEHAKKRIPGLSQLLSKRPDMFSYGVWPGYFRKAKGATVWDLDGNKYTDMSIGGIGANVLGYADKDVDSAVMAAIKNGSSSSLNCPEDVELADVLCELHPWAEMVRFARTGGESMAIAVRIARAATGKDAVAFCGYHGWHDWYLSANIGTEDALGEHLLSGLSPDGVPRKLQGTAFPFSYNELDELKKIVKEQKNNLGVIVMEPIRGNYPTKEFINGVRSLADENGLVLIIDEISAGFRMNSGGAHMVLGIQPDIAVFSKALGNGYPIGAVIGKKNVMEAAQKTFISSTNWTERIGPTAALATIRKHQRLKVWEHLIDIAKQIQKGWRECADMHNIPIDISGIPPFSHFSFHDLDDQKVAVLRALFVQLMLEKRFLASTVFYSMFAHTNQHVQIYLEAVEKVFKILSEYQQTDRLFSLLKGKPAVSGFKRLT